MSTDARVVEPDSLQQMRVGEQDIILWSHENMAVYKAPRVVLFVDVLPRSGTGKVMWRLLQEAENGERVVRTGPGQERGGHRRQRNDHGRENSIATVYLAYFLSRELRIQAEIST